MWFWEQRWFRRAKNATGLVLVPWNVWQASLVIGTVWSAIVTWWTTSDPTHQWTRLEELKLFFGVAIITTVIALTVAWSLPLIRHRWAMAAHPAPRPKLAVVSPPVAPPPKRSLTGYEIEQTLRKIDDLLDFIRSAPVAAIESGGNQLRFNPWGSTKDFGAPSFVERCIDYRNDVNTITNRMEQMRSADAHHPDIVAVLPALNDMGEFSNAVSLYARAIESLAKYDVAEVDFATLLEPHDLELRARIIKFARWRGDAMNKLMQLRKNVSS